MTAKFFLYSQQDPLYHTQSIRLAAILFWRIRQVAKLKEFASKKESVFQEGLEALQSLLLQYRVFQCSK